MTGSAAIAKRRGKRGGNNKAQRNARRTPIHYTTEKRETVGAITEFGRMLRNALETEAIHAAYRD